MKSIIKLFFFLICILMCSTFKAMAGGGKLVIIMEESSISNQYYRFSDIKVNHWTDPDHHSFDFHNEFMNKGYQLISSSNSPFGWCYLAGSIIVVIPFIASIFYYSIYIPKQVHLKPYKKIPMGIRKHFSS